jgi:hypothetical protein
LISALWHYAETSELVVVNEKGDLLSFKVTKGNTNDRVPIKELCKKLSGKLFADKGFIGKKLFEELFKDGVQIHEEY